MRGQSTIITLDQSIVRIPILSFTDTFSLVFIPSSRFDEEGKETWVPTKTVSFEEQKSYLCELYQR